MTTKKHASTHHSADAESADAQQSETRPGGGDDVIAALTQGGRPAPAPGGGTIAVQISSTVNTLLTDFEIWRNKEHH